MIKVNAGRIRSPNRVQTESDKSPSAASKTYTAPIGGLVTNIPLANASSQAALVLENFWPTQTGIEPRGGTRLRCTIAGGVKSLFQYHAGDKKIYFAADDNNIYQFSDDTLDKSALSPVLTEQTGSDYSVLENQTDGGIFLTVVNGKDSIQIYDGVRWQKVTNSSLPFAITNIETNKLNHIWAYRNRTFFVEKGTMNAWYLTVNSVAGPATKLPLAGVFNKGGSLLFGATWSSDSGDGMDDRCVFATDHGEFAVYSGGNPSSANDWQLNGVFDLGEPVGKNAIMQIGGDLIIATKAGLVPISAATAKDTSQLKLDTLSNPIEPDWRFEAILSFKNEWRLAKWSSRNMAIVAPLNRDDKHSYCWAVNLNTGAWTKFTGWQIGDIQVLGDWLYYGDSAGNIYLCDVGGTDNDEPFECRACFHFDHLGSPGAIKVAHMIKGIWKYKTIFSVRHSVAGDYKHLFSAPPPVPISSEIKTGEWDISPWDKDLWASFDSSYQIREKKESVSAHGEVLAPQINMISAQKNKLDCELISINLTYSTGGVVV